MLKKVEENQELLRQAAKAIDFLDQQNSDREQQFAKQIDNLKFKISNLESFLIKSETTTEANCKGRLKVLYETLQQQIQNLKNGTSDLGQSISDFESNDLGTRESDSYARCAEERKLKKAFEDLDEKRLKIYFLERQIEDGMKSGMSHQAAKEVTSFLLSFI